MSNLANEAILEGIFDDELTKLEARLNTGVYSEDEIADKAARLAIKRFEEMCQ
tara:strand:+ start:2198 stop:2356 length:159 start_codon:yes stop_codon:yes gene_type:complete